jgi:hypothetical protein
MGRAERPCAADVLRRTGHGYECNTAEADLDTDRHAAAALLAVPALAGEPLDIRIRPHVSVEPVTLALDVVVERHGPPSAPID